MKLSRVVVGLLFIVLSISFGCEKEIPPKEVIRPVRAIQVGDIKIMTGRSFPGKAKGVQEVELSFRVAGPLITRPINVGDEVKKGDQLAQIDPRDFQVTVQNVQGQLAKARAALERAQSEYDRVLRIQKQDPGAISQSMVDKRKEAIDGSKAEIRSLQAAVDAAKDQLQYTNLQAPFDGTVVAIYVENFESVQAKQPVVRLVDTSSVEMIIDIPENIIQYVDLAKESLDITVRFDTFPDRELPARIKEIGREASRTTRTYPVTLIMDQPENIKILPGMTGKASSKAKSGLVEQAGKIEIPETSVFTSGDDGKTFVWVIDEKAKEVHQREIKTGDLTDYGIVVTEGLKPAEWIATAGVHYLREGQKVAILGEPAANAGVSQ